MYIRICYGFQSTLPTRGSDLSVQCHLFFLKISIHAPHEGERRHDIQSVVCHQHFNPRSPRGGATPRALIAGLNFWISIHAPHEGERRDRGKRPRLRRGISIHAPHEGERLLPVRRMFAVWRISIHAPHEGERHYLCGRSWRRCLFQSTLPTRGSDERVLSAGRLARISIHAPHEGERRSPRKRG